MKDETWVLRRKDKDRKGSLFVAKIGVPKLQGADKRYTFTPEMMMTFTSRGLAKAHAQENEEPFMRRGPIVAPKPRRKPCQ